MVTVLLLNPQRLVRESWLSFLTAQAGIDVVGSTGDPAEACKLARFYKPRVIVVALDLIHVNALQDVTRLRLCSPRCRFVLIAPYFPATLMRQMEKSGVLAWLTCNSALEELSIAVKRTNAGFTLVSQTLESDKADAGEWERAAATLTAREWEIAGLLGEGNTAKQVAAALNLSWKTIEVHRQHILRKLGCKKTVQLAGRISNGVAGRMALA